LGDKSAGGSIRKDLDLTPAHDFRAQLQAIGELLDVGIELLQGNSIRLDYGDVTAIIFQDGHYEVFRTYLSEEREKLEDVLARIEENTGWTNTGEAAHIVARDILGRVTPNGVRLDDSSINWEEIANVWNED
jgi:hypothetical protein